jgi:hypothetical protein
MTLLYMFNSFGLWLSRGSILYPQIRFFILQFTSYAITDELLHLRCVWNLMPYQRRSK